MSTCKERGRGCCGARPAPGRTSPPTRMPTTRSACVSDYSRRSTHRPPPTRHLANRGSSSTCCRPPMIRVCSCRWPTCGVIAVRPRDSSRGGFDQPQERVLAGPGRASRVFAPIEGSLRTARPEACALSTREAADLVRDKAMLLKAGGFGVLLPGLDTRLNVRVTTSARARARSSPHRARPAQLQQPGQLRLAAFAGRPAADPRRVRDAGQLKEPLVQLADGGSTFAGSDRTRAGVHPEASERPDAVGRSDVHRAGADHA